MSKGYTHQELEDFLAKHNPYHILGLKENLSASPDVIRTAYYNKLRLSACKNLHQSVLHAAIALLQKTDITDVFLQCWAQEERILLSRNQAVEAKLHVYQPLLLDDDMDEKQIVKQEKEFFKREQIYLESESDEKLTRQKNLEAGLHIHASPFKATIKSP